MNLKKRVQQLEEENKFLKEENRYLKMALEAIEKRLLELEVFAKEKSTPSFVKEDVRSYHHKTINTENIICGRYCKTCDKIVEPKVTDALPNARFGLRLMLLVLALKLDSRVPS